MSFSADKVNILKGAFSQRRFSSSKDPSESGTYTLFLGEDTLRHVWELQFLELQALGISTIRKPRNARAQDELASSATNSSSCSFSNLGFLHSNPPLQHNSSRTTFPNGHIPLHLSPRSSQPSNPSVSLYHMHRYMH
ncbi:hypothetical protein DE146DRAFT_657824 [Phaeosphaeria sp. MPI-PUGE-AT-0046c]|nr:hypothetical protein DE146DRAFT_657824 [Phaeosphaeria sp. MPI-PUGE-AT-0046c]